MILVLTMIAAECFKSARLIKHNEEIIINGTCSAIPMERRLAAIGRLIE